MIYIKFNNINGHYFTTRLQFLIMLCLGFIVIVPILNQFFHIFIKIYTIVRIIQKKHINFIRQLLFLFKIDLSQSHDYAITKSFYQQQLHNTMDELLESIIESANPQLIEKYINKYLPDQTKNLERIYNELLKYRPSHEKGVQNQGEIRLSDREKKKKVYETPVEVSIRRAKSMLTVLKEKGMQMGLTDPERGIQIVEREKQKFLKPLKMNPIAPFLKKGKINELNKKYQLNKQFYQNPPIGFDLNQVGFDPEMTQFIQMRKKLQKAIEEKRANRVEQQPKPKKYQSVQSKLRISKMGSLNTVPSLLKLSSERYISKEMLKSQTKNLMDKCNKFMKITIKSKPEQNMFTELKNKLGQIDDINIDEALKTKVKQNPVSEKLQRYNLPYMTYLKQKEDYRTMSSYKKDLLKDEIKMRGIVNFQD